MRINNQIYEIHGHGWWSDFAEFEFASLRYWVNPVRYQYINQKLRQLNPAGKAVLDLGCGGGFLAEELAKDGFAVTGVDPAAPSIEAAQRHAKDNHLSIDYRVGKGEDLAFADDSFDVITCCDVLEHVDDLPGVIKEISRTLKSGGFFFYDTINRTWLSNLVMIKLWQDWPFTRMAKPNMHIWEKFIRPSELDAMMEGRRLFHQERKGISLATKNPFLMLRTVRSFKKGRIGMEELAATLALRESADLSISYIGFAVKVPIKND